MCRSIKVLRRPEEEAATAQEIRAAALQFVRKISGFHKPSKANERVFETAVEEIAQSSERLLQCLAHSRSVASSAKDRSQGFLKHQEDGATTNLL